MPVIGLSLAVVPILGILLLRALLKLAMLPFRGAYALARSRPGRTLSVLALAAASFATWTLLADHGRAAEPAAAVTIAR